MAFRLSNNPVGILNAVMLLLSVQALGAGIWLGARGSDYFNEREIYPSAPVVALGVFLVFISVAGLVGASRRITCLLWFYLCAMFILTALLFCITVFAVPVTNKGAAGEAVSGRGYKEYYWLQNRLENNKNWNLDSKTLQAKKWNQDQFFHADLFPLEHRLPTNESFKCHRMLSQSSASGMFAAGGGEPNHIDAAQPELNSSLHFDPTVQFIDLMILAVQAAGRRLYKKNKSLRGKGTAAAETALPVLLAVAALPNGAVAARSLHGGGGEHVQAASGPVAAAPSPAVMMPKSLASSGRSSCANDPNTIGFGRPCIHHW